MSDIDDLLEELKDVPRSGAGGAQGMKAAQRKDEWDLDDENAWGNGGSSHAGVKTSGIGGS